MATTVTYYCYDQFGRQTGTQKLPATDPVPEGCTRSKPPSKTAVRMGRSWFEPADPAEIGQEPVKAPVDEAEAG